ncbi:hypothetical protein T484DRAFT_1791167 [Baffinella frigidus]|nr:hypothetical protein T484DRAFT_1791167 [Cryptophyta sp. CCMP2293]
MERALRILRTRALCAGVSLEDVEELAEAGQGEVSGEVQQEGQEGEGGEAERPDGVLRLGEHAPNVEDDTLQGVDIGDGWLRYWDVGESAHFFFHMETGETRWVAPGEEDEYEAGEGQEGQEEGGAAGDAAAAHEEGGGVGFGQVGGEGEWAREYGGKAFPAGAWAALGDSAAAPKYLDPEGENAGSKYVPPAATRCTYPDGYNWDAYAAYNGFRSGQEAYFQVRKP